MVVTPWLRSYALVAQPPGEREAKPVREEDAHAPKQEEGSKLDRWIRRMLEIRASYLYVVGGGGTRPNVWKFVQHRRGADESVSQQRAEVGSHTSAGSFDLLGCADGAGTIGDVTAKEKLMRDVLDLDEAKAARARIAIDDAEARSEMVPLPEGWGKTLTGEPMPDVAAAVRRSREEH